MIDTIASYIYDANGNLTRDDNKGITYEYDLLGHLKFVTTTTVNHIFRRIEYVYAPDGRRLEEIQKLYWQNSNGVSYCIWTKVIGYCGQYTFKNGTVDAFHFDGGYCSMSNGTVGSCHFYLQDYQGNNRMVVNAATDSIEQVTHYYPYGGLMADICTGHDFQPYKYGGKQLDRYGGLDLYDFHARQLDPLLPGFTSIDPHAEDYYSISPYAYCGGDPVNRVDPDGRDWFETDKGFICWQPDVHSQANLQNGYTYIGANFEKDGNEYRDDGAILFSREKDAYKRMLDQLVHSKSKKHPLGKEQESFVLDNGSVMVMPDNWNDCETSTYKQAGFTRDNHILTDRKGRKYGYIAQVHTHTIGADKGLSDNDRTFAEADPDIMVYVMHGDGIIYSGYYSSRKGSI